MPDVGRVASAPAVLYRVEYLCHEGYREDVVRWRGPIATTEQVVALQRLIGKKNNALSVVLLDWRLLSQGDTGGRGEQRISVEGPHKEVLHFGEK